MRAVMDNWEAGAVSPQEALALVNSGQHIFVHGAAATPSTLIDAMVSRSDLRDIKLFHLHLESSLPFVDPAIRERFLSTSLFTSPALRKPIADGYADFIPVFLSDIPSLFYSGVIRLDAALLQLSPPDKHGYCSLGTSVDAASAAFDNAGVVIAEINHQMPRTHGPTMIKLEDFDAYTVTDRPLPEHRPKPESAVDARIGELVAELVEDRSTLQMGIGTIPDAVLKRLTKKSDLGVHTEMFSDGIIELAKQGVITNKYKNVFPRVMITSFVSGTRRLFDFVDDNPLIQFLPCDKTNDTALIRKNDRVVAINSALQVDLSGQVCADSFGHKIYSGIGGQLDFIRGAALSKGGKPIIALPSTAADGHISRIVLELSPGAGVVTTRGHVHWIVTEYGAVNLHGRSLRERAEALISIAHPDFRSDLRQQFKSTRNFLVR